MIPSLHGIFASATTQFVGPLDQLINEGASVIAAYSVRRLLTTYTGIACRLRSNGANTEGDINFLQNGDIDLSAISALIASDGGSSAFCVNIKNQSSFGATRDATQSTTSSQPNFSSNYQGKGAIGGNGVTSSFLNTNLGTLPQPFFIVMVLNFSGISSAREILTINQTLQTNRFIRINANNTISANTGSTLTSSGTISTGSNKIAILGNGASSSIFINDILNTNGNMGNTQLFFNAGRLGRSASQSWFSQTGNTLSEFILFNGDPTSLSSWSAFLTNQKNYFGTP